MRSHVGQKLIKEEFVEFKGKRIHQRMTYDNYLLFAVDDKQKVSSPNISPY